MQIYFQHAFVMKQMDGSMTQIHLTVSNYLAPFLENKLEKNVGPQIPLMQQLLCLDVWQLELTTFVCAMRQDSLMLLVLDVLVTPLVTS